MHLVILAAGRGSRLEGASGGRPKSLVEVAGVPYLQRQLRRFALFPFKKKIIVGGFGIGHLRDFLSRYGHSDVTLVENPDFLKGNLFSLLAARDEIGGDFWLFNADHYYSEPTCRSFFSESGPEIAAFCDRDRELGDDDMKALVQDDNGMGKLVTMAKTLKDFSCGYVGVTRVPGGKQSAYWRAAAETVASLGDSANVESVLNRLAASGESVRVRDISGSWWTEIDTAGDLERARAVIGREEGEAAC